MTDNASKRLIWLDIETFGLEPGADPIIEIGFKVTNLDLRVLAELHCFVWEERYERRYLQMKSHYSQLSASDKWVFDTHATSGLWHDARLQGRPMTDVITTLIERLEGMGVKGQVEPLCGSSVSFDRKHLDHVTTSILSGFSYRNIDISSLKELCMRYNPEMFEHMNKDVQTDKAHRVMSDINDSIAEFKWYYDNFLWTSADTL